ncbi:MAG: type II toxin-antitoxin system HicB family antitoxin [Mariniphaga sp.]
MGAIKYKGYSGTVDYSEEDNCLFGKVIGLNKNIITYEGQTVAELKADFESGIDLYLESCKERGIKPQKSYSGSLNIRIPSEVHSQLAFKAQQTGRSINAIINDLLKIQQSST